MSVNNRTLFSANPITQVLSVSLQRYHFVHVCVNHCTFVERVDGLNPDGLSVLIKAIKVLALV